MQNEWALRKKILILALSFLAFGFVPASLEAKLLKADKILVEKAKRTLTLFKDGKAIKTYEISLGGEPLGPKTQQGDSKTPEGKYKISGRNKNSAYHRSLRVSYPNAEDRARAKKLGVSPGGDIMIHGLPNDSPDWGKAHLLVDWTLGCIALTNEEIEEIWDAVPDGTTVEIVP